MSSIATRNVTGRPHKRRRKVWSCSQCRQRKLQCDRAQPVCGRCAASGQEANCTYLEDPTPAPPIRNGSGRPQTEILGLTHVPTHQSGVRTSSAPQSFEHRLRRLESSLTNVARPVQARDTIGTINASNDRPPENYHGVANMLGNSWRPGLQGSTKASSIVAFIPGLHIFAGEALDLFPTINNIRRELHTSETKALLTPNTYRLQLNQDLKDLLPPRIEADLLVETYFNNFDCIYHVIHRPQFDSDYRRLWADESEVDANFIILVLIVMAISLCLTSPQPTSARGAESTRDRVTIILQSSESWLSARINTYEKLLDFQVSFLLVFAKQLNARRYKRTWANSGRLVREFMHAGLHLDPIQTGDDMTTIEGGLRRHLWTAAIEFELQAAFEQGMLAVPWPQQSTVRSMQNLVEESGSETFLGSKLGSSFSSSSYLIVASRTTNIRHRLNSMINDVSQVPDFAETKTITEEMQKHLEDIPEWTGSRCLAPRALLCLNIHQYMLALHVWQLRHAPSSVEGDFSRMIISGNAMKLIEIHKSLLQNGNHTLETLCVHLTRAALSLCFAHCTSPKNVLSRVLETHVREYMQDAISMIKERAVRFSGDQRQLWVTIAAKSYMDLEVESDARSQCMQSAVEDFCSMFSDPLRPGTSGSLWYHLEDAEPWQADQVLANQALATSSRQFNEPAGSTVAQRQPHNPVVMNMNDMDAWILDEGIFDDWMLGAQSSST